MATTFPIFRALALELEKLGTPVVLRYELARLAWNLYKGGAYDGQPLSSKRKTINSSAFSRMEKTLQDTGILKNLPGVSERSAYSLIGATTLDRNVIICCIDPFCYLSHLSAMEFHGLTDRIPAQIYVSTPAGKEWTTSAQQRMEKDLGEDLHSFIESDMPILRRTTVTKIGQRPVHKHASIHHGAFRTIKNSPVRVATIGRTFLDMLREPSLCGGIEHVLDVFKAHSDSHKRLIFDEIDQHGGSIDKVRAGYIMEELCGIRDTKIDAWSAFAARGGSRKLDPTADYEPTFSERWMLSLNVGSLMERDD